MPACVSRQDLQQLLDGRLSVARRVAVDEHLGCCSDCEERLKELSSESLPGELVAARGGLVAAVSRWTPTAALEQRLEEMCHVSRDTAAGWEGSENGKADEGCTNDALLPTNLLAPPLESGDLGSLEHYRVLSVLGAGGTGVVVLARDVELERNVAIKLLRSDRFDATSRARFLREARASAKIHHQHVVPVYSVAAGASAPYLVMEYVAGPSLRQALAEQGPLSPQDAARIAGEVALGLAAAHDAGLIHRDVKPGNIMLAGAAGQAMILDFGLARAVSVGEALTAESLIPGTPEYMSPEQIATPGEIDPRTDVYSLGATLYEMLTGSCPFSGPPAVVVQQVLAEEPRSPRALRPDIPRDLETICLRALEKEPARRYPSARAMAADVDCWRQGLPILARPARRIERLLKWQRRHRALSALAGLLCLTMMIATVMVGWQWMHANRQQRRADLATYFRKLAVQRADKKEQEVRQLAETAQERKVLAERERHEKEQMQSQLVNLALTTTSAPTAVSGVRQTQVLAMSKFVGIIESISAASDNSNEMQAARMNMRGRFHEVSGEHALAAGFFLQLRQVLEAQQSQSPDDPSLDQRLADCCQHLGYNSLQAGQLEQARSAAQASVAICTRLLEREPGTVQHVLMIADNQACLAETSRRLGDADAAREAAAECRSRLEELDRAPAANLDVSFSDRVSQTWLQLAQVHVRVDRLAAAVWCYQRAVARWERLLDGNSSQPMTQLQLGTALCELGDIHVRLEQPDQAGQSLEQAIALLEQSDLHTNIVTAADATQQLGRAYGACCALLRHSGRGADAARHAEAWVERGNSESAFLAACELSRCADLVDEAQRPKLYSRALGAIETAIQRGFSDYTRLESCTDLAPVRGEARFRDALKGLREIAR